MNTRTNKSTRKKSLNLGLGEGSAKKKLSKPINGTKNKYIENDENMFDIDEFNNQSTTTTTIGMGKKNSVEIAAPPPITATTTTTTTTTTITATSTTSECSTPKSHCNRITYYEDSPFDDYDDSDSSSASPQFFTLTQRLGNEVTWRSPTKKQNNNDKEIEGTPKYIPRIRTQLIRQKIRKLKNQFDKFGTTTTTTTTTGITTSSTNYTNDKEDKQQPEEITGIYKFEEERKKLALMLKNANTNKSLKNTNDHHNNDDYQITRPYQRQRQKPQSPLAAAAAAAVAIPLNVDLKRQSSGNFQMLFDENDSFIADCSKKLENILQNQNYDDKPTIEIEKSIPIIKTQKITTDFKEFNKTIKKQHDDSIKCDGNDNPKIPVATVKNTDPFTNDSALMDNCLDNSNILKLLDDNDSLIIQCSQQFDEIFPVIEQQNLNNVTVVVVDNKIDQSSKPFTNNRKSSTPLKKSFSFKMKRETIYQKTSADINNKSLNELDNDDLLLGSIEIDQFLVNDDEPNRSKMKRYNSMPSPSSNSLLNSNNSKFCDKIETKIELKNHHSSLAKIKNIHTLSSSSENSSESGSSRCTAEEINEKRRIAMNRLKNRTKQFSSNKGKS